MKKERKKSCIENKANFYNMYLKCITKKYTCFYGCELRNSIETVVSFYIIFYFFLTYNYYINEKYEMGNAMFLYQLK